MLKNITYYSGTHEIQTGIEQSNDYFQNILGSRDGSSTLHCQR